MSSMTYAFLLQSVKTYDDNGHRDGEPSQGAQRGDCPRDCPVAQLGTYSTYFSESAWGADVHTDTKNTVVLALCDDQKGMFDENHQGPQVGTD